MEPFTKTIEILELQDKLEFFRGETAKLSMVTYSNGWLTLEYETIVRLGGAYYKEDRFHGDSLVLDMWDLPLGQVPFPLTVTDSTLVSIGLDNSNEPASLEFLYGDLDEEKGIYNGTKVTLRIMNGLQ